VVLFGPIANERHQDPNFPDPSENNARIEAYSRAMAEVARAHGVLFIDLFEVSQRLFAEAARQGRSLSVNGVYLTEEGDRLLAPALFSGLFAETPPSGGLERLREVVNEKNRQWHQRYRTVDGYNVYGGRSALAYQPGEGGFISDRDPPEPYTSNYEVMQAEMRQRDVLTANRDQRVWAVARGGDLAVDDSNLPPVPEVPSNKPGSGSDGSHVYLDGEEAISRMTVHSGMQVNLFADEKQFPELINPVQMAWDTQGRLWVAVWPNYPERAPDSKTGDSLVILEDTDRDGRADRLSHFIDDLNAPTGFQFFKDGVLLMQAPDLWFVRDTDGDGRADWKQRVLMGMDSADSHHTANALCLDPGGAVYLSDGVFHRTQVETAAGPVRNNDAAIYRFEPRTGRFETYVAYGFANPHGRVFDYWGNDLITDATGNANYFGPAFSGYLDYPAKHPGMREFWNRPSRPCPATGLLTSRHFPEEFQGNFLNLNVISFQGIFRVRVTEEGSGLKGETLEHLISSTDPNFRPIAISIGPDGAIYFCDWHQAIIGHMQHHIRDPNRDHRHGRVYRITYKGRPLMEPPKIHAQPIPALLELLKEPENQTRELAKIELGKRESSEVIAATKAWAAALDRNDPAYEHHLMEALWIHQWHNVVDADLLKRMLRSPEPRARAAAGRVLCYWRDRVPDALAWFRALACDEHPRVRLEAVRAASFFRTAEAADMALEALRYPADYYIHYTLRESLRQLEPWWRKAIAGGQPIAAYNPAGIDYLVASLSAPELLKLPRIPGVLDSIIARPEVPDADRAAALVELAKARGVGRVDLILDALETRGRSEPAIAGGLARLLPLQWPEDLRAARPVLASLATKGSSAQVRRAAWAGIALADGSFDTAWSAASDHPAKLTDLVGGIPLLLDPEFRATAYERVKPLLSGLPSALGAKLEDGTRARFIRIELPRRGTLTLAEVQVFHEGQNLAPKGTARQSSTAHGGEASRAIDGRTDGAFASGTQSHTRENQRNPWWELDLGREQPIDSVVIWNRTDGNLSERLEGFTLSLLDGERANAFREEKVPASSPSVEIVTGGDPVSDLRRAAIEAIVSMPRQPAAVFASLAGMIKRGEEIPAAAEALKVLPRGTWPRAEAASTAMALAHWAKTVPAEARTALDFVQTVQVARDLAGFLPAESAAALRRELRDLSVSVFVIRTVREQMRFDTPRLIVEAGKPFELIVENADFMPHNLVIVKPGTRERVGTAAASLRPDQLDAQGRAYVPGTSDILAATRLLESGQQETLKLIAPSAEGDYEYVCTFPGHHQVMWGWLIVTGDVDAYAQLHPEARPVGAALTDHTHHGFE
jgi:glucose/arabinose dehydrogenase/azurin